MRRATYRLQMRAEFGFGDAAAVTGYLSQLGISDVYCSPILQAAEGSTHGYDVVDHSRLSKDLGGEEGFAGFRRALEETGLGLTVDIVPNHMAIDSQSNRWWWDVLENGPSSPFARYFDIDWPGDGTRHEQTVLVPVLGDHYGRVLDAGDIALERRDAAFRVRYFDHELPVSARTLDTVLSRAAAASGSQELADLAEAFGALPHAALSDAATSARRHEQKQALSEKLATVLGDQTVADAVDAAVAAINSDADELDSLLCRQNYRLAFWRTASEDLDYRRFFNIETLVGLRVEDDQVFADTHETIGRLVRDGAVTGLRVDHVDGLRDPAGYLERLRRLAPDSYIVVEKILDSGEHLPAGWPVQGTTGYDFITRVSNAYVDPAGERGLTETYERLTGQEASYPAVVRAAKMQIMAEELAPEVDRLTRLLHGICDGHRLQRDRTRSEVRDALRSLLASFPVYRTYAQPDRPLGADDTRYVAEAVRSAKEADASTDPDLLDFIGDLLLLRYPGGPETEFAQVFPQVSAPVMAKGAEDTAFYRYHRLVALNEVGGDPGTFGRPLQDFHAGAAEVAERFPLEMITLATHDTKRSPDVRARIALLSEMPEKWEAAVTRWMERTDRHAGDIVDANTRYMLFQTLVGTWPIGADRLHPYIEKAIREAKLHTSWTDTTDDYESAVHRFVDGIVSDTEFVSDLEGWLGENRIVDLGRRTSISQLTVLLTNPGVPDIYQGTESWDDSLVDPDNRRPVDYRRLAGDLDAVRDWGPDALGGSDCDWNRAKVWLVSRLLAHRAERPEVYAGGTYEPLEVTGPGADRLIAYDRGGVAVIAARHLAAPGDWSGTDVTLPAGNHRVIIGGGGGAGAGPRPVGELLGGGPVAVVEF